MTGISRNWNLGIQLLGTENVLCLSDDLEITDGFKEDIASAFEVAEKEHFVIIGSFASFIINYKCIESIGWFDERFMGFGEEDGDYIFRFINKYQRKPRVYYSSAIRHLDLQTRGDEVAGTGKYSLFNLAFRCLKYKSSKHGIQGTFSVPQEMTLPIFDFHPMETFRRKNTKLMLVDDLQEISQRIVL
jgi:hypothetical protein